MISFHKNGTRWEPTDSGKIKRGFWMVIFQFDGLYVARLYTPDKNLTTKSAKSLTTAKKRAYDLACQHDALVIC